MRHSPNAVRILMLTLVLIGSPAGAQWELGAAVIARDAIQRGADNSPFVVPLVQYTGERVYFSGIEAGLRLRATPSHRTTLFARPRLDGYQSDDDAFLEGMATRRHSLDGGLRHDVTHGAWRISAALTTDLLGRHDGQTATVTLGRAFGSPRLLVVPYAGVEWMSADLVDYYYGVGATEARPGRSAYRGTATWNIVYGARVVAPLAERWTAQAIVAATRYGDGVADSPLTDGRDRAIGILGVSYRF